MGSSPHSKCPTDAGARRLPHLRHIGRRHSVQFYTEVSPFSRKDPCTPSRPPPIISGATVWAASACPLCPTCLRLE